MKVLVGLHPTAKSESFVARRVRKNIKGALELKGITWEESIYASPDICHFLSPEDEDIQKEAATTGVKTVISALYSELDSAARFLVEDIDGFYKLSTKATKILSEVDLIFVPSFAAKSLLVRLGIKEDGIKIVSPGVNLTRFDVADDVESNLFYHYFRFPNEEKYAVIVDDFENKNSFKNAKYLAESLPNMRFYFFSSVVNIGSSALKHLKKNAPNNLYFSAPVDDDVYRSALINASFFISFDEGILNPLGILEAMAARTPVVVTSSVTLPANEKINEKVVIRARTPQEAALKISTIGSEEKDVVCKNAYALAKENSLSHLGEQLLTNYNQLLNSSEVYL